MAYSLKEMSGHGGNQMVRKSDSYFRITKFAKSEQVLSKQRPSRISGWLRTLLLGVNTHVSIYLRKNW